MSLIEFMHEVPFWVALIAVSVVAMVYSVGLMLVTRNTYGVDRLSLNNEVAGFKFAVVGVFYAVLLAFVVIAVWEEYRGTEAAVRDETKAMINLYQLSQGISELGGAEVRDQLRAYAETVHEQEWPAMAIGQSSEAAAQDLHKLTQTIFNIEPVMNQDVALYQEAVRLLTKIVDSRVERLESAKGTMPGALWFVLVIGGLVTLGYPAFFASASTGAQILMTAALAGLVGLALLLALAFDFPFTGDVHISPAAFKEAMRLMSER